MKYDIKFNHFTPSTKLDKYIGRQFLVYDSDLKGYAWAELHVDNYGVGLWQVPLGDGNYLDLESVEVFAEISNIGLKRVDPKGWTNKQTVLMSAEKGDTFLLFNRKLNIVPILEKPKDIESKATVKHAQPFIAICVDPGTSFKWLDLTSITFKTIKTKDVEYLMKIPTVSEIKTKL